MNVASAAKDSNRIDPTGSSARSVLVKVCVRCGMCERPPALPLETVTDAHAVPGAEVGDW